MLTSSITSAIDSQTMSEKTASISLELQTSKAISTLVETFSYKTQKYT